MRDRSAVIAELCGSLIAQPPNNSLQTDKVKLSRLLHSQEPRQFVFAADLGR